MDNCEKGRGKEWGIRGMEGEGRYVLMKRFWTTGQGGNWVVYGVFYTGLSIFNSL